MATDRKLENQAFLAGSYGGVPFTGEQTELIAVLLADVTIVKEADREIWFQGEMTFTITITNEGEGNLTGLVVTDTLDYTKIDLVSGSVQVGGVTHPDYTYVTATGLLTINNLPAVTPGGGEIKITFRVVRID